MQRSDPQRIEYLDSIRGLAAMAVVFSHYVPSYGPPYSLPAWTALTPVTAIQDGLAAVTLFFVLSGLVLSIRHFGRDHAGYSLSKWLPEFYVARLARIYLPFLATLAIAACLKAYCDPPEHTVPPASEWNLSFWSHPETAESLLRQAFLFHPSVAPANRLIPMDWTLTTELNYSLWFPFLVLIALSSIRSLVVFTILSIALMEVNKFLFYFTMGIIIAANFQRIQDFMRRRSGLFKLGLFCVAMFLYSFRQTEGLLAVASIPPAGSEEIWYATGIGSGLILVSAIGSVRFQHALKNRILLYLGKISYSIYLLHFPIIKTFTPFLLETVNRLGVSDPVAANYAGWLGTTAFVVLASSVSYRLVELPSIRLGRWIVAVAKNRWPESSAPEVVTPLV